MKKIMILIVGLLFVGVNVYAAGDLQVNGALGVGRTPPANYKMDLLTTTTRGLKVMATMDQDGVVPQNSVFGTFLKSEMTGTATGIAGGISLIAACSSNASTVNSVNGAGFVVAFASDTAGTTNVNESLAGGFTTYLNSGNRNYNVTQGYGFKLLLQDNRFTGTGTLHYTDFKNINIQDASNDNGALSVDTLSGIWVDKQTLGGTSSYGLVLNGDGAIGSYGAALVLGASQNAYLYGKTDGVYVYDGTAETKISPHDPETGEWIYYSRNIKTGKVVRVDMAKLVKAVEKLTGETFMVETLIQE